MQTHRLDMRADPAFLSAIDEWRRHEADIPSRTEAVRRLVLKGLAASGTDVSAPARRSAVNVQPAPVPKFKRASRRPAADASEAILADVSGRPWRAQRGAIRKAVAAHPGWAAIKSRDGLNVANLSSRDHFRPVCKELGLCVPSLDE